MDGRGLHELLIGSGFGWDGLSTQKIGEVIDSLIEQMHFARESLDLQFGTAVDFEVQFAAHAILRVLPILAHHDDGSLDGSEHGEEEVEEDERVRIPGFVIKENVGRGVDDENGGERDDEGPGSAEPGN